MQHMFSNCKSLTSLDLSNFNTQKVYTMSLMFTGCCSLTNLDLSNFNITKRTSTTLMFASCDSLRKNNIITKDERILKAFI